MVAPHLIRHREVLVAWHVPDDLVSRSATHLVVHQTEHECHLSFFEVRPPLLVGSPDDVQAALQRAESVPAVCVARIMVAAARMPAFIQVLQDHVA